ncbi:SpoIID/LytB domain-containing protein [Bacillus sp. EAC]|uniref:SpoIID/LytB domain-containing protein n=1 Tax=Bacillus sp. EAC TaxID=1978338 RepID=UPI000B4463B8|nr:SpoIID/LytB domain-containing protein [Bacillus sp. EAC]
MKKLFTFSLILAIIFSQFPLKSQVNAEGIEPLISVKLVNYLGNKSEVTVKSAEVYAVKNSSIKLQANTEYKIKVAASSVSLYLGDVLLGTYPSIDLVPFNYNVPLMINGRSYLGNVSFKNENNYVRPINTLPIEDYLKGVVPNEMPASWNIEALKAQTISARTYAMRYANTNKTIDDTISYQVYGGYTWNTNSTKAVDDTFSRVLKYNNQLIDAVFSASNGGKTESNANAWGSTALPYLPIKNDPYDIAKEWNVTLHKTQIDLTKLDLKNADSWWTSTNEVDQEISSNIKTWMKSNGYSAKDIKIVKINKLDLTTPTSGGRMSKGNLTVDFIVKGELEADGSLKVQHLNLTEVASSKIRAAIGLRKIQSYLVTNTNATTTSISLKGKGDGHGVGLSQYGAKKMGESDKNYQDIVSFYYPGTTLSAQYSTKQPRTGYKIYTPKVNSVSNVDKQLTGKSEPDTMITLVANGKVLANAKTDSKGVFVLNIPIQKAGTNLTITASFEGFESDPTVIKVLDKMAPVKPVINNVNNNAAYVTGKSEAYSTVTVKIGTKTYTTKAYSTGSFKIVIPVQKAGTLISVTAKDSSGNISSVTSVNVVRVGPNMPTLNAVYSASTLVQGTAEKYLTIQVKIGTKLYKAKVYSTGTYKLAIPKQKVGTKISVNAIDSKGNTSATKAITVVK